MNSAKNQPLKERLMIIDAMKTNMMLAVVLYHCCMFFTGSWFSGAKPVYSANNIVLFARYLNQFAVQSFTAASGFLFCALRTEAGKYHGAFGKDLKKRAKRLLVPYFAVMVTWAIPFYSYYDGFSVKKIFWKYILGTSPSQLWFLPMLFILFAVFRLWFQHHEVSILHFMVVILFSIVGGTCFDRLGVQVFQIGTAVKFAMYYYLGVVLYHTAYTPKKMAVVGSIAASVGLFSLQKMMEPYGDSILLLKVATLFVNYIGTLVSVVMIYSICSAMKPYLAKLNGCKLWSSLQKNSFGIYLFHQQIIYLTIGPLNGRVPPVCQVVVSFAVSLAVSLGIVSLLRRSSIGRKLYGLA